MSKLHPDDHKLFELVNEATLFLADWFDLPLKSIRPLSVEQSEHLYGKCSKRGNVWLRVRGSTSGHWDCKPDYAYVIADLIAHELAHLRHQKHCELWFILYADILGVLASSTYYAKIRTEVKKIK